MIVDWGGEKVDIIYTVSVNIFTNSLVLAWQKYVYVTSLSEDLFYPHIEEGRLTKRSFLLKIVLATWGQLEIKAICQSDRNLTGERRK